MKNNKNQNVIFIRKNGRVIPMKISSKNPTREGILAGGLAGLAAPSTGKGLKYLGIKASQQASKSYSKIGPATNRGDELILAAESWKRSSNEMLKGKRIAQFTSGAKKHYKIAKLNKTKANLFGKASSNLYKAGTKLSKHPIKTGLIVGGIAAGVSYLKDD